MSPRAEVDRGETSDANVQFPADAGVHANAHAITHARANAAAGREGSLAGGDGVVKERFVRPKHPTRFSSPRHWRHHA